MCRKKRGDDKASGTWGKTTPEADERDDESGETRDDGPNALRNPDRQLHLADILGEIITCFNLGIKTLYYQNFLSSENADGLQTASEHHEGCTSGACSV